MKLYQIVARVTRTDSTGWTSTTGLPTFYLRDDLQGIQSERHAGDIARHLIYELAPNATIHVTVSVSEAFEPSTIGA